MRKALNYSAQFTPEGIVECDNFTCGHCQRIVMVPPGSSPFTLGGGCRLCEQLVCSACVDKGTCRPWEERMLEVERRYETDKMISRLVGREP